jgi:hypothetical protein
VFAGNYFPLPWVPVKTSDLIGNLYTVPKKKAKLPLSKTHPELAKEADGWDPSQITYGSGKKFLWRCNLNHTWEATVNNRTAGDSGCPFCLNSKVLTGFNDIQTTHPEIAKEANNWDPKKVSFGSGKKVSWKCSEGHIWEISPNQRVSHNTGCPYCSNNKVLFGFNDLHSKNIELASEADGWNPKLVSLFSSVSKKWKCPVGHSWWAKPSDRARGDGCPFCSGRRILIGFNDLRTSHPEIAEEADGWNPEEISFGSNKLLNWICELGHTWRTSPNSRTKGKTGCPTCAPGGGFDPNKTGYLYFINHQSWEMFQIGITNTPDDRIQRHKRLGWEILEIRGPMDGHLTQQWETAILRMLKAKGANLANEKIAGKFDGYSEAWSKSTFKAKSIQELMRLTEEFEENKSKF